nr:putative reverse transcriptase domain-containing protein [Tanacetum cinerariifolium]
IRSFPKGTSCGQDRLRAQHLMDILGGPAFAVADNLLGSITGVVNLFLSGKCPSQLREYIASAPLTPLVKPCGGIRLIPVGTGWRRLVYKVSSSSFGISMNTCLQDFQFGVGVPGGYEAVLHFVNRLVESKGNEVGPSLLLVDFSNAFNLNESRMRCPSIAPWPRRLTSLRLRVRLVVYSDKTEIFWPVEDPRSRVEGVFPINIFGPLNGVKLLGDSVSLDEGFCRDLALKRVSKTISLMEAVYKLHDPQCELLLLCNCVGVAKLSYALRTCSTLSLLEAQVQFDQALLDYLKKVVIALGPGFGDWWWRLATVSIKLGGLRILSGGNIIQYATTCNVDVLFVTTYTFSPQMMKTLAKCYFGVIEKDIVSKYSLSQVAILNCIRAPYAQNFLFTIPINGLGQRMNHRQFWSVLCYTLSVPMFSEGSLCPSCNAHQMDQWGDHAIHYCSEVGVKFRHNLVRDILVDICSKVGIMGANSWAPGVALYNVVEKKKRKYASICEDNRCKFIPFAFSTFGEFNTEALDTLSRIKAISITHSNNVKSDVVTDIIKKTKSKQNRKKPSTKWKA